MARRRTCLVCVSRRRRARRGGGALRRQGRRARLARTGAPSARRSTGAAAASARLVCVSLTAARGAPSWLGRDAGARAFCFMSDGTLAPARARLRCWGCNVWGWARGRAAAALFWTSGARGAAAPLDEVMAHLRPWSSRCEHVKAASAAFTHEPCSCGSPAPRLGSGVAPAATSTRCSSEALYGSGAADVAFRPAPLHRGSAH